MPSLNFIAVLETDKEVRNSQAGDSRSQKREKKSSIIRGLDKEGGNLQILSIVGWRETRLERQELFEHATHYDIGESINKIHCS